MLLSSKLPYSSSSSAAVAAAGRTTMPALAAPQRHPANTHAMRVSGLATRCFSCFTELCIYHDKRISRGLFHHKSEHVRAKREWVGRDWCRPVESRSRAWETIITGPCHNLILIRRDRDARCVEREESWGGVSPHHTTMGLGSVVSSPTGSGGAPAEMHISSQKPSGTPFSVFLSDGGPPSVAGPGKTFPSPLSTGLGSSQ